MRLRMLVSRLRLDEFPRFEIYIIVSLARPIDAIGPVQTGVEPLRGVGSAFLRGKHEAKLVVEGSGVIFGVEITALPAPVGPGTCEPVKYLLRVPFAGITL